ncbi:MAG: pyridoxamine 5'-phosphate oxidase family protein [Chloroflexi bacterium]|nr:pyridoxamine 5'-phosphate oxidase family protein [Chloroflexota bacterium]MCC6891513.1 pyridoxamine 5'-phosphate oxidase family protein [Anaerolineae bacterium]
MAHQGDLSLLNDPIAQTLLTSTNMARLAYVWDDGTPRVIPIWFHWDGKQIVFGTPVKSPKMHILPNHSKVAVTIDSNTWPYKVLSIRGTVDTSVINGVVPEYALAAERYFGVEGGQGWINQVKGMFTQMARVAVTPEWVGILDFEQRYPSAIAAAMTG